MLGVGCVYPCLHVRGVWRVVGVVGQRENIFSNPKYWQLGCNLFLPGRLPLSLSVTVSQVPVDGNAAQALGMEVLCTFSMVFTIFSVEEQRRRESTEPGNLGIGLAHTAGVMIAVSLAFTHSFIYSFIHSFIHLFIHSLIHSFIHSFIHSLIHSFIHSFIHQDILVQI